MSAEVVLRRATATDGDEVRGLVGSVMGWGGDASAEALWSWKHERNPFGASPTWVAVAEGRVVGVRTFLRWEFRQGARVLRCVRAVDTVTHPDHRGRGLFRRLTLEALEHLAEDQVAFVFNTPNRQSRPGYLSMGWEEQGRLPVTVLPHRLSGWGQLARSRTAASLESLPTSAGVAAPREDRSLFGALRGAAADEALTTNRTDAYFAWRYAGLPGAHYRVVTVDLPRGLAAAVLRLRRRGAAVEAAVVESCAPDRRSGWRLMREVVRATGASYALALPQRRGCRGLVLPRTGPVLTTRVVREPPPPAGTWNLSLGDVELF